TCEIGILKGKFSYMSLEQIRGMPLDARTDVFSAGIILHEMLTTEKLFRGDTEFALMEKVRKAEVPPPSNFNRRVTPELDAISLKALARDVADRYQSAAQLAADLDALIAGYRFDPKELRQFMRQLFRKEYAKEIEETEMALEAEPNPLSFGFSGFQRGPATTGSLPAQETPTSEMQPIGRPGPKQLAEEPPSVEISASSDQPTSPPAGTPSDDKKPGFWGSLFKRKK